MGTVLIPIRNAENTHDLSAMLKLLDAQCRSCSPITPLECISRCKAYKLKNELRKLHGAMENPNYLKELFNVLKNEYRLLILQAIVNGRFTVSQLQQELKKTGHGHSQDTIIEEYLRPLMQVGLAAEAREEYYATKFGARLTETLGCFPEFAEKLPTHSECYEETLLQAMQTGPKTFEEIEAVIPPIITPRTLKRLEQSRFIETPIDRDYVFFFKTKRDPNVENFRQFSAKFTTQSLARVSRLENLQRQQVSQSEYATSVYEA